jgi:uncharacterized membrane protein
MLIRWMTKTILVIYTILIIYTLVSLVIGVAYHPTFTPVLTLLAFSFALLHGWQNMGWKRTLLLFILTFGISLLFETVGVSTGLIYGTYHYTNQLGPKFLGLVPWLIPVAWFMMTYPSYVIARGIAPSLKKIWVYRLLVAALGGVIMTAWDLAMDPMMVAGGHWVWDQQGAYFGIPLQNFCGWWLTSFLTFWLFLNYTCITPQRRVSMGTYSRLAAWSYTLTGLSSLLTDFIFGLDGPALVGIFAMLPWMVMGGLS